MTVLGTTGRSTTVNKVVVNALQRITTPSFITLDMFALVVLYLFAVLFVRNNDDCLVYKISTMMPFVPIRLYKRYDLRLK